MESSGKSRMTDEAHLDALAKRKRKRPVGLRGEGGWTLMELMVVTTITAVLAGIAVPQFTGMATQMRTQAGAAQVLSDINWARMMSLRTGVPHYVNVTGAPSLSYTVKRAQNPPAIDPGNDPTLRTVNLTARMPAVQFSLAGATTDPYGGTVAAPTPGTMVFTSRGLPAAPGSFFVSSTDGETSFAISVTGAGRARVWRRSGGGWH